MRKKIASDIAHITIRIREDLRKKLVAAADSEQRSLNSEIALRLESSFEAADRATLGEAVQSLNREVKHVQAVRDKLEEERNALQDPALALMNVARIWLRLGAATSDVEEQKKYRGFANELRELIKQVEPHSTEGEK